MGNELSCARCGNAITLQGKFCQSCGQSLLPPDRMPPRIMLGLRPASTVAGRELQCQPLIRRARQGRLALRIVAIVQTVVFFTAALKANNSRDEVVALIYAGVVAMSWGLFVWSGKSQFAATVTALVIYATLTSVSVTIVVTHYLKGASGFVGFGIGPLDVCVLYMLSRSVVAGSCLRQLQRRALPQHLPLHHAASTPMPQVVGV